MFSAGVRTGKMISSSQFWARVCASLEKPSNDSRSFQSWLQTLKFSIQRALKASQKPIIQNILRYHTRRDGNGGKHRGLAHTGICWLGGLLPLGWRGLWHTFAAGNDRKQYRSAIAATRPVSRVLNLPLWFTCASSPPITPQHAERGGIKAPRRPWVLASADRQAGKNNLPSSSSARTLREKRQHIGSDRTLP